VNGTILHSDQGFQYTSHEYHAALQQHGIIPSMSRKANCLDNACIENFFSHLKTECIYLEEFNSMDDLEATVHKYIIIGAFKRNSHILALYNTERRYVHNTGITDD